ncbi:MAG: TetR/AcrR family transcriptional regulator [Gammaproteobacteria bacterium]
MSVSLNSDELGRITRTPRLQLVFDRSVYYSPDMLNEQDTRQRIITSARDLIHSRSYASVGVAEICDHAAVKKGSFYHFFPSKQALSLAVIESLRIELEDRVLIPAFARDLPPLQRLGRFITALDAFQRSAATTTGRLLGCPFGNLALELATSDEVIRHKLESVFAVIQARFEQVLGDARDRGDIDPEAVDIAATAQAMLAYIEGVLILAKTANDPELITRLGSAFAFIRIHRLSD